MAHVNINRVVMTANLTADAELRSFPSGARLVTFRIANNGLRGEANFFDVEFWGERAEKVVEYLTKGRAIAIDGRLQSKEWEAGDGTKRYGTCIVADSVEFLSGPREEASTSKTAQRGGRSGTRSTGRTAGKGGSTAKGRKGSTGRTTRTRARSKA
jgi:single-strand DNA-binding protein